MNYRQKYLKYKNKYMQLKGKIDMENNFIGGQNTIEFDDKISDANHIFAINLFNNFDSASNIFSPLSINYALSLLHLAALEKTNLELSNLLKYKYTVDDLQVIHSIFNDDTIDMTNLMLVNKTQNINKKYKNMVNNLVKVIQEDFENPDLVAQKINHYVENKTNGLIKDIISPKNINNEIIMILVNTVYFKSKWKYGFDANKTFREKFGSEKKIVDLMNNQININYYENKSFQIVEIPYQNENYVMGIILPKIVPDNDTIDYTINNVPIITAQEINELINNLSLEKVDLYIPKFTDKKKIKLVPILKKMGLIKIFDTNMCQLDLISNNMCISNIIHEAVIIIDESGTTASAATVVTGRALARAPKKENIKTFRADHPFVYYIRHIPTNMFLFFGDFQG
ncbi:putative serpin-like protein [Powai lake megavirus]|uniref:Putative serpin-like protein n=1 Tax=Powai lake megavirus TaxID=1842663 RepID=A0A167R6T5_9VIRU|nr:putative serpin-like protein [Powai lake megavirus]ANB50372.1 putative serpin-like protein [Powai lake megavirus]